MPPVVRPQTGMKRGPVRPTAAQANYLEGQAARRPTVTPTPSPATPNQFSASGMSSAPAASSSAGMSASGPSSIPAASAPGASASPTSLNMVPSGSTMRRGGSVKRYAAGGATETNQYGSWGGANAQNAVSSTGNYGGSTYGGMSNGTALTGAHPAHQAVYFRQRQAHRRLVVETEAVRLPIVKPPRVPTSAT